VLFVFFILGRFFGFLEFFFFLFLLDVVFLERSPGGDAVGLCFFADFVLFCVDQAGGEGRALVIA
jgi:hypothetical protein